jgi:predicted enzyme related to lactoylglutathione lyase
VGRLRADPRYRTRLIPTGKEFLMANPHGSWIWYELLTTDADAAAKFYSDVVGWTTSDFDGAPGDYTIFNAAPDDPVGGVMTNPMPTGATWLGYVGVDDVDASVAKIESLGGKVHLPPTTMEGVGRMAMVEDPQGVMFYVMRGDSPEDSRAFARMQQGKVSWNELQTIDNAQAFAFYGNLFGWEKDGAMPMPWGEYAFVRNAGQGGMDSIWGAIMPREKPEQPVGWTFYFRVPDIMAAHARVRDLGGTPLSDPMEVPGGERVFHAKDPQGATFGLVAPQ